MARAGNKRGYMEIERLSDADLLRCPICLDTFQTPRALACLHTFCEPCLELYLADCRASARDGHLQKVECPLCGHTTVPIDTRKHPHSMVKDFPINHFILPHTDINKQEKPRGAAREKAKKNVQFVQYCGSCSDRSVHTEAVVYCNDCGDFQCSECVENHTKMKFLTRHKFVRIERVSDSSQYANFYDKHTKCRLHQREDLRFYCEEHDALLCSICAFDNHKACEMVNEFDEHGRRLKENNQHKVLRKNLKGLQLILRDVVEAARTNNFTMMRESEDIPKRIHAIKSRVLRMFEYLEDTAEKKIRDFQTEFGKKNSERALRCKQLISAIESSCAALDTLVLHGTNHQLFSMFQVLKEHLQEFNSMVEREKEQLDCVTIVLKLNDTLEDLANTAEAYGGVFVEKVVPELGDMPALMFTRHEDPLMEETPILEKKTTIKEKESHIQKACTTACYLKKMVAVIFEVKNRSWLSYNLVLLDAKNLNQVLSVDLKRGPKNIIAVDMTTVAVTYPNAGMIEFYVFSPKKKNTAASLHLDRTVKCDIRDAVMAKYKGTSFAISTGNFFGEMGHDGALKQSFYYSVSLRVRETDFWSTQLAVVALGVDVRRKRLYVASTSPDKLYSMTLDGRVMFELELSATVTSLDVDKDGKIYLCCHRDTTSGKISKVSPSTGKMIGDISVDMTNPSLIYFDKKRKQFFVFENMTKAININKYKYPDIIEDEDTEDET